MRLETQGESRALHRPEVHEGGAWGEWTAAPDSICRWPWYERLPDRYAVRASKAGSAREKWSISGPEISFRESGWFHPITPDSVRSASRDTATRPFNEAGCVCCRFHELLQARGKSSRKSRFEVHLVLLAGPSHGVVCVAFHGEGACNMRKCGGLGSIAGLSASR